MELVLTRDYYEGGTNGELQSEGKTLCHTIELPWRNNRPCFSCIPEGRYLLEKRNSNKFNNHLQVMAVKGRRLILIHPANDARKQLMGCIAPVMATTGEGTGNESVLATNLLYRHVVRYIATERVWLVIRSSTGAIAFPYVPPVIAMRKMAA